MPHTKSAKKYLRKSQERRLRNKIRKTQIRTFLRKLREAVQAGNAEEARKLLPVVHQKIDKACKHNVLHRNTAARRKSLADRMVRSLG